MKKVTFSDKITIHNMVYWSFAYRNARKGKWEENARDRERFSRRIDKTSLILLPVLKNQILMMSASPTSSSTMPSSPVSRGP